MPSDNPDDSQAPERGNNRESAANSVLNHFSIPIRPRSRSPPAALLFRNGSRATRSEPASLRRSEGNIEAIGNGVNGQGVHTPITRRNEDVSTPTPSRVSRRSASQRGVPNTEVVPNIPNHDPVEAAEQGVNVDNPYDQERLSPPSNTVRMRGLVGLLHIPAPHQRPATPNAIEQNASTGHPDNRENPAPNTFGARIHEYYAPRIAEKTKEVRHKKLVLRAVVAAFMVSTASFFASIVYVALTVQLGFHLVGGLIWLVLSMVALIVTTAKYLYLRPKTKAVQKELMYLVIKESVTIRMGRHARNAMRHVLHHTVNSAPATPAHRVETWRDQSAGALSPTAAEEQAHELDVHGQGSIREVHQEPIKQETAASPTSPVSSTGTVLVHHRGSLGEGCELQLFRRSGLTLSTHASSGICSLPIGVIPDVPEEAVIEMPSRPIFAASDAVSCKEPKDASPAKEIREVKECTHASSTPKKQIRNNTPFSPLFVPAPPNSPENGASPQLPTPRIDSDFWSLLNQSQSSVANSSNSDGKGFVNGTKADRKDSPLPPPLPSLPSSMLLPRNMTPEIASSDSLEDGSASSDSVTTPTPMPRPGNNRSSTSCASDAANTPMTDHLHSLITPIRYSELELDADIDNANSDSFNSRRISRQKACPNLGNAFAGSLNLEDDVFGGKVVDEAEGHFPPRSSSRQVPERPMSARLWNSPAAGVNFSVKRGRGSGVFGR